VDHPGNAAVSSARTTLSSFSAVDASDDSACLVAALDEQARLPAIERLRATVLELLLPRPGAPATSANGRAARSGLSSACRGR
jgi:hypothetical protein